MEGTQPELFFQILPDGWKRRVIRRIRYGKASSSVEMRASLVTPTGKIIGSNKALAAYLKANRLKLDRNIYNCQNSAVHSFEGEVEYVTVNAHDQVEENEATVDQNMNVESQEKPSTPVKKRPKRRASMSAAEVAREAKKEKMEVEVGVSDEGSESEKEEVKNRPKKDGRGRKKKQSSSSSASVGTIEEELGLQGEMDVPDEEETSDDQQNAELVETGSGEGDVSEEETEISTVEGNELRKSPFNLIFEGYRKNPWHLLISAIMAKQTVRAPLLSVIVPKMVDEFPTPDSIMAMKSTREFFSYQECQEVPQLPWVLNRLQVAAKLMQEGKSMDNVALRVGGDSVRTVWRLFGAGDMETDVSAYYELVEFKAWLLGGGE